MKNVIVEKVYYMQIFLAHADGDLECTELNFNSSLNNDAELNITWTWNGPECATSYIINITNEGEIMNINVNDEFFNLLHTIGSASSVNITVDVFPMNLFGMIAQEPCSSFCKFTVELK